MLRMLAALPFILAAAACGGSSSQPGAGGDSAAGAAEPACLEAECRTAERLTTIPDAENLIFDQQGRLFVTGDAAYEIVIDPEADTTSYLAQRIDDMTCTDNVGFLGLAIVANTLYTLCGGQLWAGSIDGDIVLQAIYNLPPMGLANGMASDGQGRLYITDGPTTQTPQIVRVTLNPNDPLAVLGDEVWTTEGLEFPNGITWDGSAMFIADASLSGSPGLVKRIALNPDGSAGTPTVIYEHASVLDDLDVFDDDSLIVSDFTNGRVFLIGKDGTLLSSSPIGTFVSASAVMRGTTPLFGPDDILVTDKGVIGERLTPNGNALFAYR